MTTDDSDLAVGSGETEPRSPEDVLQEALAARGLLHG